MKKIIGWIKEYWQGLNKLLFLSSALLVAILVYLNYHYRIYQGFLGSSQLTQFVFWAGLFFISFGMGYLFTTLLSPKPVRVNAGFLALLCFAVLLFAWKVSADFTFRFGDSKERNIYFNQLVYWPIKLCIVLACLLIVVKPEGKVGLYGLTVKGFSLRPYLMMLLLMIPLIAAASTQPDFLHTYPKYYKAGLLRHESTPWFYKILYELSYGSDFISIEVFLRGFLVLAFARWFGADAILPMAMFYCTIHFGKPLGECISSFFGGMILGVVTLRTGSIIGGLVVHLGIAWLMELGGHIGHQLFK